MRKLFLLVCILGILSVSGSFAQIISIDTSKSVLFPKSCDTGSLVNLKFYVFTDSAMHNETVHVLYRVKNSPFDSSEKELLTSPDTTTGTVNFLSVTDSNFKIDVPNAFFIGEDIVVIWPTGTGGIAFKGDSIIDTVHVHSLSGISPLLNSSLKITVYPNPTENLLSLNYNDDAINLEQVRIYDILGRTVLTKTSSFKTISITSLPDGFYFLEAITADKSRYITQFTKSQ